MNTDLFVSFSSDFLHARLAGGQPHLVPLLEAGPADDGGGARRQRHGRREGHRHRQRRRPRRRQGPRHPLPDRHREAQLGS